MFQTCPFSGSPKLCWLATTAKHANPAPCHNACHLILLKTKTKQPILTKALQPTPLAIVEPLPQTLSFISRSRLPTESNSTAPLPCHWHRLSSAMIKPHHARNIYRRVFFTSCFSSSSHATVHGPRERNQMLGLLGPGTANWITFAWWRATMSSPGRAGSAPGNGKLVGQKQYLHWTCMFWFEPIWACFRLNWLISFKLQGNLIDVNYV